MFCFGITIVEWFPAYCYPYLLFAKTVGGSAMYPEVTNTMAVREKSGLKCGVKEIVHNMFHLRRVAHKKNLNRAQNAIVR